MKDIWDKRTGYEKLEDLTDEMIIHAENKLGVRLPQSYIDLCKIQNGGCLVYNAFPTSVPTGWAEDHVSVEYIMGIGDKGILYSEYYIADWELPKDIVLLCGDGHWWIAMDYRNTKENPPIIYIDLEWGEDIFELELAPDFETFINGLFSYEGKDEDENQLPVLYQIIKLNNEISDSIDEYCDFRLVEPGENADDYSFKCDEKVTVFGEEASGGCFALYGKGQVEKLPILYVTSEGQAGIIAQSFSEFTSIIVNYPYWRDLLKFSGNGNLTEMYKANDYLEKELLEEFPEYNDFISNAVNKMNILDKEHLIEKLHTSVKSNLDIKIYSLEEDEFDSLFNTFNADDNPMWK